ncbi:hypothetical protein HX001_07220 [Empedobacter brevis]|uniref:Nucleotide modification associated domain-containing protein n=1 Tax=Empedobacter brevis TaxID=247 RepID=A0AAJ1QE76_9FLAO|nr:hypothetical protein [Empedobacter brevis]MDM1072282.1 hypothetical protein [Empedobacter brevis]
MLKLYTYVLDHDLGLAPNPFWGYCTLAVCKPKIRKSKKLSIGNWIIGTGSRALEKRYSRKKGVYVNNLIYAMEVNEIIKMEDYWNDSRFLIKRPNINGSLAKMYGDNIYSLKENGEWVQLNSAHSLLEGAINEKHLKADTGGINVLISNNFYYLGDNCVKIPEEFKHLICNGRGERCHEEDLCEDLINWIKRTHNKGVTGEPIDWTKYNQLTL